MKLDHRIVLHLSRFLLSSHEEMENDRMLKWKRERKGRNEKLLKLGINLIMLLIIYLEVAWEMQWIVRMDNLILLRKLIYLIRKRTKLSIFVQKNKTKINSRKIIITRLVEYLLIDQLFLQIEVLNKILLLKELNQL